MNIVTDVIDPSMRLLPQRMDSDKARVMLVAIGMQESGLKNRVQIVQGGGAGPARGLWQFERGGGVKGVLTHPAVSKIALGICEQRRVDGTVQTAVWDELSKDDILACCFARLLLYTDPNPLPPIGDEEAAWQLYNRVWRPGKPHRDRWASNYPQAVQTVTGG